MTFQYGRAVGMDILAYDRAIAILLDMHSLFIYSAQKSTVLISLMLNYTFVETNV
jgi:hypothetical protein